ncbi:hypothetical protein Plec18167_002559 [Paecilomyces lecythidis]|uniref:BZIP domain-containing protein n=1 Tax=Paecilomyces lecythidis TaxID=3004212 RepID=A0ABR3Y5H9_9EURO
MSQHSASSHASGDPTLEQNRTVDDGPQSSLREHVGGTSHGQDTQETVPTQAVPWNQLSPVEQSPVPTQPRSIGVHAILNPPETTGLSAPPRRDSRDHPLDVPASTSPHLRRSSSPAPRPARPSSQFLQTDRPSLSPGVIPRRIITPVSPAARSSSLSGRSNLLTGKISVSESPFVQEPSTGLYGIAAGGPLSVENSNPPNAALQGRHAQGPTSMHSTPVFHSRRPSGGPATNPSSQATSPSTPHSTYSHFGQSPPMATTGILQPPTAPSFKAPPFMAMDPLARAPSVPSGSRYSEEGSAPGTPHEGYPTVPGMIPVIVDYKSGSRSQAEKRKANSDASRRFRNRKKNELALEQRISSQAEQIRMLTEERDYYRSERDFYRETVSQTIGLGQLPPRPASPRHFRSSLSQSGVHSSESVWRGSESSPGSMIDPPGRAGQSITAGYSNPPHLAPLPPVSQAGWSGDRLSYSAPSTEARQSGGLDDRQGHAQQPYPSGWRMSSPSVNLAGRQNPPSENVAGRSYQDLHGRRDPFDGSWNTRQ